MNFDSIAGKEIISISKSEYISKSISSMNNRFHRFSITPEQVRAWEIGFDWIYEIASSLQGKAKEWIFLPEFSAPLVSGRPDLVIITPNYFFVIEMKTGASKYEATGAKQVLDYSDQLWANLKLTRNMIVVPVLLTHKRNVYLSKFSNFSESSKSTEVVVVSLESFIQNISSIQELESNFDINKETIFSGLTYSPRPSVVQAAMALVAATEDKNVVTGLSDEEELLRIEECIKSAINESIDFKRRSIIFVSGSPGAGKTLVGLRLAHDSRLNAKLPSQVGTPLYLTGNGPLVDVLVETLARDEVRRKRITKKTAFLNANAKIRSVHGVTERNLGIDANLIIFDEGQRIWTRDRMQTKKGDRTLLSEAEEILVYLESHTWCTILVLIGEGQEINDGEFGVTTWIEAIKNRKLVGQKWYMFSPLFRGIDYSILEDVVINEDLVLRTSRRTDNAADLANWTNFVLQNRHSDASRLREEFAEYPLYVTRNLERAKSWLREKKTLEGGNCGLVATSTSKRLFQFGVDVVSDANRNFNWAGWYLNELPDLNSAEALEVAATEFKCQGLELDWVGVCWSWDLVLKNRVWTPRRLRNTTSKWKINTAKAEYAINSYRVILTRSRKGMVVWVPIGNEDSCNLESEMGAVYDYLIACGATAI